jgi:UDP-N-acetylglucosamine 2-epimerase (non-hydrolysing)
MERAKVQMSHNPQCGEMKVLTVVGARPNFMKVAPIIRAIRGHNEKNRGPRINHVLVHTGQHYDSLMSDRFFADLGLPKPEVHLGVGSASHAAQTAEIMEKFEPVLLEQRPELVLVVGDVNSTMACALVTSKISFDAAGRRPLIAHVEAGLRSFDRSMPEEVNRVVTDQVSDLLFVTEQSGIENLRNEGVSPDKIHFVGNTMIDSLLAFNEQAETSTILETLGLRPKGINGGAGKVTIHYGLLTLHRPSNVDNQDTFGNILGGIEELVMDCPVVFPVHPRTRQRLKNFGSELTNRLDKQKFNGNASEAVARPAGIILTDPLGYLDFLCLMKHAAIVVTDSGGIQEETTCLGVPCVTVRENTERPVTVESGTNLIAGTKKDGIRKAIHRQLGRKGGAAPKNWDGQAAKRIVDVLVQVHNVQSVPEQPVVSQPQR